MYKEKLDYIGSHLGHLSDAEKTDLRMIKSATEMGQKLTHKQHRKICDTFTMIQKIEG